METVNYKKKIELCEKLGANKFQKVVFKVEELKYKVIKKLFPRYIEWYDKLCDRKKKKELKKATTKEEQKKIIDHYRMQKMIMRKEFHREQNRNYHMDPNKPTEILYYLNWNKDIHMKGIIKNAIAIPALATTAAFGIWPTVVIPFLALELGSLFVNFQCVNIQNCNIYRFKQREETMKKLEERRNKRNIEQYSEAGSLVTRTMEKTEDIPSLSQIIDSIQTKEELEQFRKLVQTTLGANRASSKQESDAKGSGGK
ncbi:MAG: hypothetical protein IJA30_00285 [Bacilli bacterium]|nr:hypothetical protein [Bacilli bacterium]